MNKKKIGTILILFGVGMPVVLGFFQEDGKLLRYKTQEETIKRKLTKKELNSLEKIREWHRKINKIFFKHEFKELDLKEIYEEEQKKEFLDLLANYFDPIFSKVNLIIKEANRSSQWKIAVDKAVISIKYKYFVGFGIAFIFVGIGMLLFSFYEKREKKK